jgi:hypothetical protein
MTRAERSGAALLLALALAVSCGGATVSSTSSSGPSMGTTACDHYIAALTGVGCPGAQLPSSEVSRLQKKFAPVCENAIRAPGSALTESQLDACASALEANNCWALVASLNPDACSFRGSLAAGEPCSAGTQCQSGFCGFPLAADLPDGGLSDAGAPAAGCGRCIAPAADGQPCPYGLCGADSFCGQSNAGSPVCIAYHSVGPGGDCQSRPCQDGLACDANTNRCVPITLVGAGAACSIPTTQCEPGFYCSGTCSGPFPAGHACDQQSDFCGVGLACVGTPSSAMCGPYTVVGDGAPCGDIKTLCLHGFCSTANTCQTLVADGQPCNPNDPYATTTCDTFSQCVNGTCQIVGPLGCQLSAP